MLCHQLLEHLFYHVAVGVQKPLPVALTLREFRLLCPLFWNRLFELVNVPEGRENAPVFYEAFRLLRYLSKKRSIQLPPLLAIQALNEAENFLRVLLP